MELNGFKDTLFEIINEADILGINDIDTNDKENTLTIVTQAGTAFKLECRQVLC